MVENKTNHTEGEIVQEIKTNKKGNKIRLTNFPSKKFSYIYHVRPHATNALDTYELPKKDKLTNQNETQNIVFG
jgi:hypothetical protein